MQKLDWMLIFGLLIVLLAGCRDNSPPVQRVPAPGPGRDTYEQNYERAKPMPSQEAVAPGGPMPFYDDPLLVDVPPEARAFVDAYGRVGRPRLVVFVNRGLDGQIVPVTEGADRVTERRETRTRQDENGRPGEYRETKDVYLRRGEYDEVQARSIDYEMMELLLADWMSADNQVTLISPRVARRTLSDQQQKDLQDGRPQALSEVARALDADVLIQVQAKPTKQTPAGLEVRIIAEAINIKGGESLARAGVDLVPPLDKVQMNRYTRFLARKLMDGMTSSWLPAGGAANPGPGTQPQR